MASFALHLRPRLALAAAVVLLPATAAAQATPASTLRVVVHAEQGGAPLPGARVELIGLRRAANADSAGVARIAGVPPGPTIVSIHKLGYGDERFPLTVPAGDTVVVEVDLQPAAVRLAEVRARAFRSRVLRDAGFFNRQRMGLGSFATRADWEGRGRLELSDVVRRMRGIRVARTRDGRTVLVPPAYMSMNSNCRGVAVFVDGAEMTVMTDDINQLVSLSEVEAVESYSGPGTIPPQFNPTGAACGVVVIWRCGAG